MPAAIPPGCPPDAAVAASRFLLPFAVLLLAVIVGLSLITPQNKTAATLPDTCGSVMMALSRSGAHDVRDWRPGRAYVYMPQVEAIELLVSGDKNLDDWQALIRCREPVADQVAAIHWPLPVSGITDLLAGGR